MIISQTPLRISFVGGGSDLPSFYKYHPGAVVASAINKYIYIAVNKKFDQHIRVSYSKTEIVKHVEDIKHELVRECLKKVGIKGGIEITSIADIPSEGTGLGSSSSYTVGLLNALYAYKGKFVNSETLAREACDIEIKKLKKPIGKQDQYIAAYGGFKYLVFNTNRTVSVNPLIISTRKRNIMQNTILLFYTGIVRDANQILIHQDKKIKRDNATREKLLQMTHLAKTMKQYIEAGNINDIGNLLKMNWDLKIQLEKTVTNDTINHWISLAYKKGAEGAKILGAGGGGFLLICANSIKHPAIVKALTSEGLLLMKFTFESEGSRIIYYS